MTLERSLVVLKRCVSRLKVAVIVIDFVLLGLTGVKVTSLTTDSLDVGLRSFVSDRVVLVSRRFEINI